MQSVERCGRIWENVYKQKQLKVAKQGETTRPLLSGGENKSTILSRINTVTKNRSNKTVHIAQSVQLGEEV